MQAASGVSPALSGPLPMLINRLEGGSSASQQTGKLPSRKNLRRGKGLAGMRWNLSSQRHGAVSVANQSHLSSGGKPATSLLRLVGKRLEQ